jgi:hypothetical protein
LTVAHAGKTLAKQPNRERARHTPLVVILLKRTLLRALMNRLQIVNELIIERYRGLNRKVIGSLEPTDCNSLRPISVMDLADLKSWGLSSETSIR